MISGYDMEILHLLTSMVAGTICVRRYKIQTELSCSGADTARQIWAQCAIKDWYPRCEQWSLQHVAMSMHHRTVY
jgi:hypothetical protein